MQNGVRCAEKYGSIETYNQMLRSTNPERKISDQAFVQYLIRGYDAGLE